MAIVSYTIASSSNREIFQRACDILISKGYEPYGELSVVYHHMSRILDMVYSQAFVLKEK